jgi:DUF177 domain-containing protein
MVVQCLKNKGLRNAFFDTPGGGHYDTAPMPRPPQRPLDALGLARNGAVVEREFPVADFARLRDRLADATGTARVRAAFREIGRWPAAELGVEADVVLTCQRCLKPMPRRLASESQLVFADEGSAGLPEGYEAVEGDPQALDLAPLVEDELLLALPIIPQHAEGETCALPSTAGKAADAAAEAGAMRRPFAGLKDLLKH